MVFFLIGLASAELEIFVIEIQVPLHLLCGNGVHRVSFPWEHYEELGNARKSKIYL